MIAARGLARIFKTKGGLVEALRGVDFLVAEDEIVGFLGPDGAGKTTVARMLSTLLDPSAGDATVAGRDLTRDPRGVRRKIGDMAQGGCTIWTRRTPCATASSSSTPAASRPAAARPSSSAGSAATSASPSPGARARRPRSCGSWTARRYGCAVEAARAAAGLAVATRLFHPESA